LNSVSKSAERQANAYAWANGLPFSAVGITVIVDCVSQDQEKVGYAKKR
jgi:hypothetical protein